MMKTICVSPTRALHAALRYGKLGSEDICCVSFEMQQGLYALRFRSDWLLYDSYVDACSGEVVQRDGSRQPFDRVKLINGMVRACEKRPVSLSQLESIADDIEQELQSSLEREVSTVAIGEMVMSRLKAVDEVAYVRFASVYRSFKDINTFMEELTKLLSDK